MKKKKMTNKERHIAVLNRMLENMDVYDSIQPTTERKKAIKAAIKALEQQPCDDAVSRQAVLDLVNSDWKYEGLETDVASLPPVTPQQKYGKWIGHREHCENLGAMPSGLGAYEWCSNCDCGIDVREWHRNNYNYCPNCGAKMQESEDKE